ncbi:hypothetical protein [Rhodococcus artemisiae]|uniref:Uncharacterized protein n=1 Tax=Rhodococcus artemisiae TaxID=714159 RepID=A0ABU7LL25_9NOCA|nr:hypothetical protein [Rhodococcus artemisiae]MEE2062278.1 hypothetical protein [Rhodococcus artemisiae]
MDIQRNYALSTIALGPYDDLDALHADLANHAETAVTLANQSEGQTLVSMSHSIVVIGGKLHASVVLSFEEH